MEFIVRGVTQEIADEVRRTHLSPGYGHPAHLEVAKGSGPCRCCLQTFVPGVDRRLLFTYRPQTLPGVADAFESGDDGRLRDQSARLAAALRRASAQLSLR